MVSFKLLPGLIIACISVGLCKSEVNGHDYSKVLANLNNQLISEERESSKQIDNNGVGAKSHLSSSRFCENGTSCRSQYEKEEKNMDAAKTDPEKGIEEGSILMNGIREIRYFYEKCQKKINEGFYKRQEFQRRFKTENGLLKIRSKIYSLYNCMKITSFRHFDDFLSSDVIPVANYFELVKDNFNDTTFDNSKYNSQVYVSDILNKNLLDLIVERIEKFFKGHSLRVHLYDNEVSGRGRRRDHRMFAMMMMGFVIMASVLVPMGFQFLIVLGGKSLLMAKMALIMSAINGLKKIATSNVGYGLYHAPEALHHDPHHGYHEKIFHIKPQEQPNSPFNIVI